ncbi:MAG TPA: PAS domain S-box protein [Bacteroidota bacterium]|nr:PAS domain S-box protein [Bacteroidota bacterium]
MSVLTGAVRGEVIIRDVKVENVVKILHLEDNPFDAQLVEAVLERQGKNYQLQHVATREAFEEALAKERYHLVISDFYMPRFDGLSALELTRKLQPDIPFLFFSTAASERPELMNEDVEILSKEDIHKLPEAVARILDRMYPSFVGQDDECSGVQHGVKVLLDELADGIIMVDGDRAVRYINPAIERLYGFQKHEVLGKPLTEVLMEIEREADDTLLRGLVAGEAIAPRECVYFHRVTGERKITEVSYQAWGNRHSRGGTFVIKDLTDQKKKEENLKAQKLEYETLFAIAPEGIVVTDLSGQILLANEKVSRLLGYNVSAAQQWNIKDFMDSNGEITWEEMTKELAWVKEAAFELSMKRQDGSRLKAELHLSKVDDRRVEIVLHDVSDRVFVVDHLRASTERYRSLAEFAEDIIFSVSKDGTVTFMSTSFSRITGWTPQVWHGKNLFSLVHPDDAELLAYNIKCVCGGNPVPPFRLRIRRANGDYYIGESCSSPIVVRGEITGCWHIVHNTGETFFVDGRRVHEFKFFDVNITNDAPLHKEGQ